MVVVVVVAVVVAVVIFYMNIKNKKYSFAKIMNKQFAL